MSVNLSRLDVDQDKLKDLFNKTQDNFDELENQANDSEQKLDQLDNTKASRSEMQSADNNLAQQIDVERKRINSLASLPEGSTTGDAELQDIRIGADGRSYPTAGEAVRSQARYLDSSKVEEDFQYLESDKGDQIKSLMNASGHIQSFESGYVHYEIDISANDELLYTGTAPSTTFPALVFLDNDRSVLGSYPNPITTEKIVNYEIDLPSNCTILVINTHVQTQCILSKRHYGGYKDKVKLQLDKLINQVNDCTSTNFNQDVQLRQRARNYTDNEPINLSIIKDYLWDSLNHTTFYFSGSEYTELRVNPGEIYYISGYVYSSANLYPLYAVYNEDMSEVLETYGEASTPYNNYKLIIPPEGARLIVNGNRANPISIKKEIYIELLDLINNKLDKIYEYEDQELEIITGLVGINGGADMPDIGCHANYPVKPNDRIRVTGYAWSSNNYYPAYAFLSSAGQVVSYFGDPSTQYTDTEVVVPDGADEILINGTTNATSAQLRLAIYKELTLDEKLDKQISEYITPVVSDLNLKLQDTQYELECSEQRILKLEKLNDFVWNNFDKAYFVFVIDDANEHLPPTYDLFHAKSVPLSAAVVINNLNKVYTNINPDETRTIKDILDLLVSDGGEVLAHYTGNLADEGYSDGSHEFLTSKSDWDSRTRDVKRTLESNGFEIRGIIRADYSQVNSATGEIYCRKYFDYSDNLGKSTQYSISRKFFSSFETIEDAKTYIDQKSSLPGIYPFCLHGTEPVASIDNLSTLIDYIQTKGDAVEISTYSKVFDKIGTNRLEKLILNLGSA